jgi:hypothetical protein
MHGLSILYLKRRLHANNLSVISEHLLLFGLLLSFKLTRRLSGCESI